MLPCKRSKKRWVWVKLELKRQFPNFKLSGRNALLTSILLVGYLFHLTSFLVEKKHLAPLVPVSLAQEVYVPAVGGITAQLVPDGKKRKVTVPVLMYHYIQGSEGRDNLTQDLSVRPELLDQQLNYLVTQGFATISPEELYQSLVGGTPLPPKPILLTFDDGYRDFYTQAYPILKKYNLKATNFVISGLTGKLWYLRSEEIRVLASDPNITLAGHTLNHGDIAKMPKKEARDEVFQGKDYLEKAAGKKVDFFAYPSGSFNDYAVSLVREAGFKMAFTTQFGYTQSSETLLVQPRIRVGGHDSIAKFVSKLTPTN